MEGFGVECRGMFTGMGHFQLSVLRCEDRTECLKRKARLYKIAHPLWKISVWGQVNGAMQSAD
jgi:hypothetical protein